MLEISLPRLALSLLPILAVGVIWFRWTRGAGGLALATLRMIVQLLAVGYLLVGLFTVQNPWASLGVVAFMIAVSSLISIRTITHERARAYRDALLAIGLGGGLVLALVAFGVLDLDPWYAPRYLVPVSGMIFANAMTAVTLSAERLEAELAHGRDFTAARNAAWNASLIPQVNSFLAVGLVSLPGMMTGQILAGASPLHAVRYQIMVMAMVLGSAGLAVALFLHQRRPKSLAS